MTAERWASVKAIWEEACELPAARREVLLDQRCGADSELRALVITLLGNGEDADFLDLPPDDAAPQRAGAYRIVRKIAHGGMGDVYLAERADGEYEKQVAIKLIRPGLAGRMVLTRFVGERQVLANLDHPNIARLFDGGTLEDGRPYLVMEYVDGEPIDQYLERRNAGVQERLRVFRALCDAVQYAHEKQVIHRNIKPGNVLVDAAGIPKLLDFGIAKTGQSGGVTVGAGPMTPEYASPEQIRGEAATVASDTYALGAVLRQILPRPRPPGLDAIVAKALAYEPERRYASVRELARELDRFASGRGGNSMTRRQVVLLSGAAVAAVAVLAAAALLVPRIRRAAATQPSPSVAVLPFKNLSGSDQQYFAEGMTDAVIGELARVPNLRVVSRTSAQAYQAGGLTVPQIARKLGVATVAEGSVLRTGDHVRIAIRLLDADEDRTIWTGSYDGDAGGVLALQDRVAAAIASEIDGTLSKPRSHPRNQRVNLAAYDAYLRGREAYLKVFNRASVEQAIEWFKKAAAIDPGYAPAYSGLADCYYMMSSMYYPPSEMMPKAKWAATKALDLDGQSAEALATLGTVYWAHDFDPEKAEEAFHKALAIKPGNAQIHMLYAMYLNTRARFDEAVAEGQRARSLDPVSPAIAAYAMWPVLFSGRADEVIQQMTPLAEQHPDENQARAMLALAYEQKKDWDRAIREMGQANAVDVTQDGLGQLGHMYAAAGRTEDARRMLARLKEMSRTSYVSPYNIAVLYLGLGDRDEALRWLEKAYTEQSEWFPMGRTDPRLAELRTDARFRRLMELGPYKAGR